jgi:hypothetical protein
MKAVKFSYVEALNDKGLKAVHILCAQLVFKTGEVAYYRRRCLVALLIRNGA